MTRAVATLVGAATAAALIWTAAQLHRGSTGGYWAELGLVAVAGIVLGLAPRAGGVRAPRLVPATFVLGVLPALVVGGWVLFATQPNSSWIASHVRGWSSDIHVRSVVDDVSSLATAIALGLGVLLALAVDRRAAVATMAPQEGRPTSTVEPADTNGSPRNRDERSGEEPTVVGGRASGQ